MNPKRTQVGVLVGLFFFVFAISIWFVPNVGAAGLFEPILEEIWVRSVFQRDELQKSAVSSNGLSDQLLNSSSILSGKVFEGVMPDEQKPLENVKLFLYCSGDQQTLGSQIDSTTTNAEGWYKLTASSDCAYYTILPELLSGYVHTGASTVDGMIEIYGPVEYIQYEGPLTGKTLTGNKFWQAPATNQFTGYVYNGLVGETDAPLSGAYLQLECYEPVTHRSYWVDHTTSDSNGWYELWGPDCSYMFIFEFDPTDFVSVGASSLEGTVNNPHNISFSAPLSGQDLSGNLFWDTPATLAFSGMVFEGYKQDDSHPLASNNIMLLCLETETEQGYVISSAITDNDGWYEVLGYDGCNYYWIIELDREGYISTGASTVGGEVLDLSIIRYEAPYSGLTLTGNRFWDVPGAYTFLPLIIH